MEVEKYEIEGLLSFVPRIFKDDRGFFYESFNERVFQKAVGQPVSFCQDNISYSHKNVLRGLHFQKPPYAQGKLVRVSQGSVLDVAVDLRKKSPTYGKYQSVLLSAENKKQFWVPAGFAHGFLALEDGTVFNYKCTNFYHKESEGGLNWNDTDLAIDWGFDQSNSPILSDKDHVETTFNAFNSPF